MIRVVSVDRGERCHFQSKLYGVLESVERDLIRVADMWWCGVDGVRDLDGF